MRRAGAATPLAPPGHARRRPLEAAQVGHHLQHLLLAEGAAEVEVPGRHRRAGHAAADDPLHLPVGRGAEELARGERGEAAPAACRLAVAPGAVLREGGAPGGHVARVLRARAGGTALRLAPAIERKGHHEHRHAREPERVLPIETAQQLGRVEPGAPRRFVAGGRHA
jgi:hypothetical protein